MSASNLLAIIIVVSIAAYYSGYRRACNIPRRSESHWLSIGRPVYFGSYLALMWALPGIGMLLLWTSFDDWFVKHLLVASLSGQTSNRTDEEFNLLYNLISNVSIGVQKSEDPIIQAAAGRLTSLARINDLLMTVFCLLSAATGGIFAWQRIRPDFHPRRAVERTIMVILFCCASVAVITTLGIFLSVLYESLVFFDKVSVSDFLFGLEWSPQIALRADQQAASGSFGAIPLFAGTLLIAAIAMAVAAPIGLMSAIYLSEYATSVTRQRLKPLLEILAGIPTVVYGFFAALTVAPLIRDLGQALGLAASAESALAAGLVMGVMIIPFVSSLADDIIHAVPMSLREASLAMGATQSETIKNVVLRAALPGIAGGMLLAISRAVGETMIVVMAAGLSAHLTANPFESVTTVTVQIVTLLVGDQEFDSAKTLAAFALGLVLFVVTLALNILALRIVKAYREQYE